MAGQLNINPAHTLDALNNVSGLEPVVAVVRSVMAGDRPMGLIYGGVGNGKTHLLEGASIELYQRGIFARRIEYASYLGGLKNIIGHAKQGEPGWDYQGTINRVNAANYLLMDDIGAGGSDSEWGDKILEEMICYRHGHRLMMLMTTNRDISTLPERVLSRLQDKSLCYLVNNTAKDYRPKLAVK